VRGWRPRSLIAAGSVQAAGCEPAPSSHPFHPTATENAVIAVCPTNKEDDVSLETLIDEDRRAIQAEPIKAKAVFSVQGDPVRLTEVDLVARDHSVTGTSG